MDSTSGVADLADSRTNRAMPAITAARLRTGAHHTAGRIVTAVVIGFCVVAVALAAPASAHGPHGDGTARHTDTNAAQARPTDTNAAPEGKEGSMPPASNTQNFSADPPTVPPTVAPLLLLSGHDKCKKSVGNMAGPPWCTDPAAGWIWTTLHRADASYPTLPAARASSKSAVQHSSRHVRR